MIFRKFFPGSRNLPSLLILLAALGLAGCAAAPQPSSTPKPPSAPKIEKAQPARKTISSYVVAGQRYHVLADAAGFTEEGLASWYGNQFHGRKTASGERFDQFALTAAHKTLPFGTMVSVRNAANGQTVVVRINDRGPFGRGHVIDLSKGAAQKIGLKSTGPVTIKAVGKSGK